MLVVSAHVEVLINLQVADQCPEPSQNKGRADLLISEAVNTAEDALRILPCICTAPPH